MLFFFFKQKTAYEMRISDWSSDVCSSDLMGMDRGGVEPLKVEERNRGVDHEAEDPGAEHVPEGDRDEAHQGPAQRAHPRCPVAQAPMLPRSEEHTSELQSLMCNSYAVFCLKTTINKSTIYIAANFCTLVKP